MKTHKRLVPMDMMSVESKGRVISVIASGSKIIIQTRHYEGERIVPGVSLRFSFDNLYDYFNFHSDGMSIWNTSRFE